MSDSTPTERFPAATAPAAATEPEPSRRTLYILLGVGGALLIAIIILLIVLFTRGGNDDPTATATESSTPSASPTPTPTETTPSPTPTVSQTVEAPAPPPPPAEPAGPIESFSVNDTTVDCDGESSVPVHFSWSATGDQLWFGVGTNNAKNAPYDSFPLVYELDFNYQCGQASGKQVYTITVEIGNDLFSESVTIKE